MAKISKEKFKVWGDVFSSHSERLLFNLSSQGHFEEIESPISTGKEANIFTAKQKDDKRVIIKIYRLETADFNKMYSYIKKDLRFNGIKRNRRNVIFEWTKREVKNLNVARKCGVRTPLVMARKDNIIIMEMIGDHSPSPQLKDSIPKNKQEFFDKIIEYMRLLYQKGKLIHGDLSHFNILNYNDEPVFIDFSQATTITSPNSEDLLIRDIKNICNFFEKTGLKGINHKEIYEKIIKK